MQQQTALNVEQHVKSNEINAISPVTNVVLNILFWVYTVLCLFPILVVLAVSFSDQKQVTLHGYNIIPRQFSLDAYSYLLNDATQIVHAYGLSILVTVIGTTLGLLMTALFAYPISRQDFDFRTFFSFFLFFTMIFGGGLVPWYIVFTNWLDMRDTIWALIIPGLLFNAFYVIIMRTFFQTSIHPSIIESAGIDGAGELRIFFRIILPLSTPVMATIALFYTIGYWNDWFNSLVFIQQDKLVSLQYLMYKTMMNLQFLVSNAANTGNAGGAIAKLPGETVRMAMAIIGMGPIVLAYPIFQKYFVKGLTIGAVKG
ncbi:carbohydrate ABC transporter permease [Paenibacillus sepulcri]|uniref:Carbohydrate ABC transporter permease n=2 Tax=Paenibacillus sepulcri TaxID=359917 RepID=A0ABS7BVG0_9BACL|nr:carbohydrate ABC transporter permease [Paenibacillus sepulcri]